MRRQVVSTMYNNTGNYVGTKLMHSIKDDFQSARRTALESLFAFFFFFWFM